MWLKAWVGEMGRTVEVKQTLEEDENRPSEGREKEAKPERWGLPERFVTTGEVSTGSSITTSTRMKKDIEGG